MLKRRQLVLPVIVTPFLAFANLSSHGNLFSKPGRFDFAPILLFHSPLHAVSWKWIMCVCISSKADCNFFQWRNPIKLPFSHSTCCWLKIFCVFLFLNTKSYIFYSGILNSNFHDITWNKYSRKNIYIWRSFLLVRIMLRLSCYSTLMWISGYCWRLELAVHCGSFTDDYSSASESRIVQIKLTVLIWAKKNIKSNVTQRLLFIVRTGSQT